MTVAATARGLVELTRPVNAIAAGVLTFVGGFVAGGVAEQPLAIGAAVAATVFGTGAGNAINDYFDREVDRINAPERPIPRGAVEPRTALWFSALLFAAAIALSLFLPVVAIAIAVINLAALVAYTEVFKGTPGAGNVVVAYLGGSTFLFGAAAVANLNVAAAVLFGLAALSTVAREVIKDVEDVEGDRAEGLSTLPVVVGPRRSLHAAALLLLAAVLVSPAPYLLGTFGTPYLALLVPAVGLMCYAVVASYRNPTTGQRVLKYGMFVAALAFVVGRAAVWV